MCKTRTRILDANFNRRKVTSMAGSKGKEVEGDFLVDRKGIPRIEKYDPTAFINVISLLVDPESEILSAVTHYSDIDDLRYFYCHGGECCSTFGPASTRIILPVCVYTPYTGTGYGKPISIQFLNLAKIHYDRHLLPVAEELAVEGWFIGDVDLSVKKVDEGKYYHLNYTPTDCVSPVWRTSDAMVLKVDKAMKRYARLIERSVARKVNPKLFSKIMSNHKQQQQQPEGIDYDIEGVLSVL